MLIQISFIAPLIAHAASASCVYSYSCLAFQYVSVGNARSSKCSSLLIPIYHPLGLSCIVAIMPNSLRTGISLNIQWVSDNFFFLSLSARDLLMRMEMVFLEATNKRLSLERSCLNQFQSSSGIVNTMCLWGQSRQKEVALAASCLVYLTPHALQNLE